MSKAWVVYKVTLRPGQEQANAVCSQAEWDAMQARQPGWHTLVRRGIASEAEAERLARAAPATGPAPR